MLKLLLFSVDAPVDLFNLFVNLTGSLCTPPRLFFIAQIDLICQGNLEAEFPKTFREHSIPISGLLRNASESRTFPQLFLLIPKIYWMVPLTHI